MPLNPACFHNSMVNTSLEICQPFLAHFENKLHWRRGSSSIDFACAIIAFMASLPEETCRVLLVDDEPLSSRINAYIVKESGFGTAQQCNDSRQVLSLLRDGIYDVIFLDLNMPYLTGQELLDQIGPEFPDIPVIILTNEDKVETAVECMKRGAFDFMTKPIDRNRFLSALRHAVTIKQLKQEVKLLSSRRDDHDLVHPELFSAIITRSPLMKSVFLYMEAISASPRTLLITGESGTGKERIAEIVHKLSGRTGNFVPINVAGLDETVFSDSLFGHLRGSYTGAEGARKGLVEQAKHGTLFLDEIGDLDSGAQIKLLRLLQEGEYYPLGSDTAMKSQARVVAATNANLHESQANGSFRKDLYYRLIAHQIVLPPLRERLEDIPLLLESFVAEASAALARPAPAIDESLCSALQEHKFPGNIRELQAQVFDAVGKSKGSVLRPEHFGLNKPVLLGQSIDAAIKETLQPESDDAIISQVHNRVLTEDPVASLAKIKKILSEDGLPRLDQLESILFELALKKKAGNQSAASHIIGVSQSTLSRWLRTQAEVKD